MDENHINDSDNEKKNIIRIWSKLNSDLPSLIIGFALIVDLTLRNSKQGTRFGPKAKHEQLLLERSLNSQVGSLARFW